MYKEMVDFSEQEVFFQDLGRIGYQQAWDYQESLLRVNVQAKTRGESQHTTHHLLFCEHPPVITLGKSGHPENLLLTTEALAQKGIDYFKTNRGGDITFHGPEQIVAYPIFDLEKIFTDIGRYLRSLEEAVILTLAEYGVRGDRSPGETGVWIDPDQKLRARKICAMGVRCSRWVTMHGIAFNVNTDLSYFNYIVPCGIADKQVTSLEKELGHRVPVEEVKALLKEHFARVFHLHFTETPHLSTASEI